MEEYIVSAEPHYFSAKNLEDSFKEFSPEHDAKFFLEQPGIWFRNKPPAYHIDDPIFTAIVEPYGGGVWLAWMGTYPTRRREGHAEKFISLLKEMYPAIYLAVRHYNFKARNLYSKCGFKYHTWLEFSPIFYTMIWRKED